MTDRSPAAPAVGFIGLGVMGRPMAQRILTAGYPLTVASRSEAAVAEIVAAGATAAASPADVARSAGIVIVMVPDTGTLFDRLVAEGGGDLDHSALITLLDAAPRV